MKEFSNDRWKIIMPLICSVVLIAGMIIGFNLRDTLRNKRDFATVIERNDRLNELIDLINEKYVDTVNNNILYKDAVSGILSSLDPHTVYIPAERVESENEGLEGGFSGIGIEFDIIRDTIQVTSVFEKGPSANAGIEAGDQLVKVGDSIVAGVKINTQRIAHLLRGKQNTKVATTFLSPAGPAKSVTITRDLIPTYSVEASLMLDNATGFIKINRFTATTGDEFKTALKKLRGDGATQLIIDLRDNPGGYLAAATSIVENLLGKDKLIVYTRGVHSSKAEYRSNEDGIFMNGKLAVLVDEGSASASEILAGAIQDWDRGVIIGRRSYGKGLVQEQYDLPDGAALRLTIARYYTPSGRCIQRSFSNGRDAYQADYEKRFADGELFVNDSIHADTLPYYTANHRIVYGGGGIQPDINVPYDTNKITSSFQHIIFSQELRNAVWDYFVRNKRQLKFSNVEEFNRSFNSQAQVAGNYLAMLEPEKRNKVARVLERPLNKAYLQLQIKARMARFLFHDNGYYAVSLKEDDVVNKAISVLKGDQYSKLIHRN